MSLISRKLAMRMDRRLSDNGYVVALPSPSSARLSMEIRAEAIALSTATMKHDYAALDPFQRMVLRSLALTMAAWADRLAAKEEEETLRFARRPVWLRAYRFMFRPRRF